MQSVGLLLQLQLSRLSTWTTYTLYTVDADKDNPYPLDASVPTAKFPDGAGGIDPYHSFADMFNGEGTAKVNRELIWADEYSGPVNDLFSSLIPC